MYFFQEAYLMLFLSQPFSAGHVTLRISNSLNLGMLIVLVQNFASSCSLPERTTVSVVVCSFGGMTSTNGSFDAEQGKSSARKVRNSHLQRFVNVH